MDGSEGISDHEEELIKAEHQVCLMHLFDAMPAVVVNRVRASVSNDSKLYQQLQLPSFGFLTPRTLVTTDPEQAVAFFHSCRRRIIYKSLSGVRSIVGWYLNHSFTPNAYQEQYQYFAARDIEAGEEITINYRTLNEVENEF